MCQHKSNKTTLKNFGQTILATKIVIKSYPYSWDHTILLLLLPHQLILINPQQDLISLCGIGTFRHRIGRIRHAHRADQPVFFFFSKKIPPNFEPYFAFFHFYMISVLRFQHVACVLFLSTAGRKGCSCWRLGHQLLGGWFKLVWSCSCGWTPIFSVKHSFLLSFLQVWWFS